MLDEGAKEKGYALLCVSEPQSDCRIRVIDEVSRWPLLSGLCAFVVLHNCRHRLSRTQTCHERPLFGRSVTLFMWCRTRFRSKCSALLRMYELRRHCFLAMHFAM